MFPVSYTHLDVYKRQGRLVSFILGNLVVNLDEVVEDVFRFLGITL